MTTGNRTLVPGRKAAWIFLLAITLVGLAIVIAPAWVIQPFKPQSARGLEVSYALRRWSPWVCVFSQRLFSQYVRVRRAPQLRIAKLLTALLGSRDSKAGERLVFNQYGDQYFLSQVWLSVDTGRQLFTSGVETKAAREYKLANNNAKPKRVEIAMHAR